MENASKERQQLLRTALLANASFSTISGLALLWAGREIVRLLGVYLKTSAWFRWESACSYLRPYWCSLRGRNRSSCQTPGSQWRWMRHG